jgi:hypothetical protein
VKKLSNARKSRKQRARKQRKQRGGNNDYKIEYYNGKYDKKNSILSFDELIKTEELKNQSDEDIDKKLNSNKIKYKEGFLANGIKYMKVILDQD